jgi:hypothetical protein
MFKLRTQIFYEVVYFSCCPDCPDRIILMSFGYAKKSHDRITDKLLYKTLILGHYLGNIPKNATHYLFALFGIEPLTHCGITRQI